MSPTETTDPAKADASKPDKTTSDKTKSDKTKVNKSNANKSKTDVVEADSAQASKSDIKREISVEIPAAEVARETEVQIARYQKSARLPGFRAGHVPASIIKQRFGEGLKSDVAEALIPKYFRRGSRKTRADPGIAAAGHRSAYARRRALRFKASFEVLPEIKVEGYKELRADKPEIAVSDEEVDAGAEQRARAARYLHDGGRAPAGGRRLRAGFDGRQAERWQRRGRCKGQSGHMDEVLVEIGGKNTVPEFTRESSRSVGRGRATSST